jgi:predicted outer membrane protein
VPIILCRRLAARVRCVAVADEAPSTAPASAAPSADKPFVVRAIVAGQTIVEAGKLATAKATDKVKPLATRVVTDHAKLNATLMSLAEQRGIQPPQSEDRTPSPHDREAAESPGQRL